MEIDLPKDHKKNHEIYRRFGVIFQNITTAFSEREKEAEDVLLKSIQYHGGFKKMSLPYFYTMTYFCKRSPIQYKIYAPNNKLYITKYFHIEKKTSICGIDYNYNRRITSKTYALQSKIYKPIYIFPLVYYWDKSRNIRCIYDSKVMSRKFFIIEHIDIDLVHRILIDKNKYQVIKIEMNSLDEERSYYFIHFRRFENLLLPCLTKVYSGKKEIGEIILNSFKS